MGIHTDELTTLVEKSSVRYNIRFSLRLIYAWDFSVKYVKSIKFDWKLSGFCITFLEQCQGGLLATVDGDPSVTWPSDWTLVCLFIFGESGSFTVLVFRNSDVIEVDDHQFPIQSVRFSKVGYQEGIILLESVAMSGHHSVGLHFVRGKFTIGLHTTHIFGLLLDRTWYSVIITDNTESLIFRLSKLQRLCFAAKWISSQPNAHSRRHQIFELFFCNFLEQNSGPQFIYFPPSNHTCRS